MFCFSFMVRIGPVTLVLWVDGLNVISCYVIIKYSVITYQNTKLPKLKTDNTTTVKTSAIARVVLLIFFENGEEKLEEEAESGRSKKTRWVEGDFTSRPTLGWTGYQKGLFFLIQFYLYIFSVYVDAHISRCGLCYILTALMLVK